MNKYRAALATAALAFAAVLAFRQSLPSMSVLGTPEAKAEDPSAQPAESRYVPPVTIKGIYITSDNALTRAPITRLRGLLKNTELNSAIINLNDGVTTSNLTRLAELVKNLEAEKIHTIARIIVFQNDGLALANPKLALKTKKGALWRDQGGNLWLDPSNQEAWQEILKVAEKGIELGFREINFDYIRFPSDGSIKTATYPSWDGKTPKSEVINSFARFLKENLKTKHPDIILSVDVFAHTILVNDDANIGQRFTDLAGVFDVICPMIYPSHYSYGHFGVQDPNSDPYKIVKGTLDIATAKLKKDAPNGIVRPWLQDFQLGGIYNSAKVRAQIKAVGDAGYENGWLLWNARNVYNQGALEKAKPVSGG